MDGKGQDGLRDVGPGMKRLTGSAPMSLMCGHLRGSQARHGPLASPTHMLVTACYILASAIITRARKRAG